MKSILDYIKVFKNIETYKGPVPRNMYQGGQLVQNTVDGSRPGYQGKTELSEERQTKLKNFLGRKKKIKASVLKDFVLDLGYEKYEANKIKKKFPNLVVEKDIKTGTREVRMDKKRLNIANRYANLLNKKNKNDRHYVSSKNYEVLPSKEKVQIVNIMRANDNKFNKDYSKQLRFDSKKEKILMEAFDLTEDDFIKHGKIGVPSGTAKYAEINRFVKRDFIKSRNLEVLTPDDIEFVKDNFELPEGKEWNFKSKDNPKGYKHGISGSKDSETTNLEKQIYNKLKGSKKYTLAADRGSPQGWIMNAMERVYNNETVLSEDGTRVLKKGVKRLTYEPITNKKGIIVGFTDNTVAGKGKTYYGLKKNAKEFGDGTVWTGHGDYDRINKFLKIAKGVKEDPSKLLTKILDDKGISELTKGKRSLTLNDILSHERYFDKLSTTKPKQLIERQIVLHHAGGVGSGIDLARAAATKDIQLLTGVVNARVSGLESIVRGTKKNPGRKLNADEILKLKNYGAKVVDFDGRVVGGGFTDPEKQFASIEKKALKYAKGKDFNVKTVTSYLKALCPKGQASGGRIGLANAGSAVSTLECGRRAFTKLAGSGTASTEQKTILNEILRMGSGLMRGAGQMLNPKEFFKLRNLVGPGAWAALGAFEAGAITYDTINRNTPLKIALGNNWATGWAMPWTKKEAQIEKLEEANISGSPAMKKHMEQVKLMAEYERADKSLNTMKTMDVPEEHITNQQAKLDEINNNWVSLQETSIVERDGEMVPVTGGELEFQKAVSDMEGTWGAGKYDPDISEGIPRDLNEFGYRDVGDAPAIAKALFGKAALQGHDPMFETTGIQPIFNIPPSQIAKATSTKQEDLIRPLKEKYGISPQKGHHEIKRPLNLKGATTTPLGADQLQTYAEYHRDIGDLEPRGELPQRYIDYLQKREKWRQLFEQSPTGLHGARFATGGLANLTRTVAPDSGPMSQGLRSLYINDRDY